MNLISFVRRAPIARVFGLTVCYLLISLLVSVIQTQARLQQLIDGPIEAARSLVWRDSAELGEQAETQVLFALQSRETLNHLQWHNPLQVLATCGFESSNSATNGLRFPITLQLPSQGEAQRLSMQCDVQWLPWVSIALLAAGLTSLLMRWRPQPLRLSDQRLLHQLSQQGADAKVWKQALQHFRGSAPSAEPDGDYLLAVIASYQSSYTIEDAVELLNQASQPLALKFITHSGQLQVRLNALVIPLSVTPAIYWLWYAQRRKCESDNGWVSNPPANRPDVFSAQSLIELMEQFGGHGRAISELKQHGLRAKTLDQNRNKIKEALLGVVGETLTEACGFENGRKDQNAQSCYRLKMSPNRIDIAIDDF
ncbi:hypothetical protein ACHELR_000310 [Vibrio fluvialis]